MKSSLLVLLALHRLRTTSGFVEIPQNGTVAEFAFVDPDLVKDNALLDPESFVEPPEPTPIPPEFISQVNTLENDLGIEPNTAQIDAKAGRISGLLLSATLFPGDGANNALLWNVFEEGTTHADAPLSPEQWEETAIQAVKNWMHEHSSELNIDPEEMFAEGTVRSAVHGDGDMIQLHIPRVFKGVVVEGARASATIKLGNLISVSFEEWGSIPQDFDVEPIWTKEEASVALETYAGRDVIGTNCEPELRILTLTPVLAVGFGEGYDYALAWNVCPIFRDQENEMMEGKVDAKTGKIYSFQDTVHYLQAKGGVYPIANDGRYPDGVEQSGWPMPFMYVGSELTDTGGNYNTPGSMTFSNGKYISISDNCGSSSLGSNSNGIDWGTSGGDDCTTPGIGGTGNTHSARTNVYELNKAMEMARSHLPNNSWLKARLTVNLNINNSCNAYWSGTINFYRSGNNCGNTGELAGVIVHEWGHGLDDNDVAPNIAQPSGEGIADIYAALRMADSCIGRGFYPTSSAACTGVRNIDRVTAGAKTLSNYSGCNGSVHCIGQIYSQAVWSLYKRKLQSSPYNYDDNTALEIVTRLTFIAAGNTATWFTTSNAGCDTGSGYKQYLAADDDNGNINDGTPHMRAIYAAFNDQQIACSTPTVTDSGCNNRPNSAPQVTITPGNMRATITWNAVNGASNYQVFRTEGVKSCGQGKVKLVTTTSLSYPDTGLMNGRTYYYIVIAKGSNDSCFGPASPCISVTPTASAPLTPAPTTLSPTRKPIPPTNPPTSQPTRHCGNGVCESDESSASCPEDCANLGIDGFDAATRASPGVMFKVKAPSRDIEVTTFKFNSWQAESALIQVYSRTGEYSGYELNQSGWELVHESQIDLLGKNAINELFLQNKVVVSSGATKSFFLWVSQATNIGRIAYDAGTSEGGMWRSNNFIELYQGVGVTSKFSGDYTADVYSPRYFSGMIGFNIVNPSPTLAPMSSPTNNPTNPPTNKPTSFPTTFSPTLNPTNNPTSPPTKKPMPQPTQPPTKEPSVSPTKKPTPLPSTAKPTSFPTNNPTSQPTFACNNDSTCQVHETASTCPRDCANLSLNGTNVGTKGARGIMFEMLSKRDVTVKSFSFYTDAVRTGVIEVYTRVGTYKGNELESFGWQLVYSNTTVDQKGKDVLTVLGNFDTGVTIPSGSVQSFYIVTSNYIMYDAGSNEGDVLSGDNALVLYQGIGISGNKFPGAGTPNVISSPRIFKGTISYDAIRITSSPTKNPVTPSPTKRSSNPTQHPVTPPTKSPRVSPTKKPTPVPSTAIPTHLPTSKPTPVLSTATPSKQPTQPPTKKPAVSPTKRPTPLPSTAKPTSFPTNNPTSQPTFACNNDSTCQAQETAITCPRDCANLSLNGTNVGTKGARGIMFEMLSKRDVTVKSFSFYTDAVRTGAVEVYTRVGTYLGNELDSFGWQLAYSNTTVDQKGRDVLTVLGNFDSGVTILSGSVQSFYIVTSNYIMYDAGSNEGDVLSEDNALVLYQGKGISGNKFPGAGTPDVISSPRIFKGTIRYDAGASAHRKLLT